MLQTHIIVGKWHNGGLLNYRYYQKVTYINKVFRVRKTVT